jgi:hypothetical protein
VNHSSTPDACGERHAIGGHRRPRRGTSMLCDLHQRLRLPPSCSCRRDCVQRRERCVWTQRTPPIWLHSPQCAECNHVGGRAWVRPVRRRRWTQFCGIERGRFRRMPDGDRRTRRATSLTLYTHRTLYCKKQERSMKTVTDRPDGARYTCSDKCARGLVGRRGGVRVIACGAIDEPNGKL